MNNGNFKSTNNYQTDKVTFSVKEKYGVISASPRGWTKELNLVSWNGLQPKYDLREWSPEHDRMGKGMTFNAEEIALLGNMINNISLKR